jgi:signal transduction histidine kinase
MAAHKEWKKILVIVFMMGGILCLHYFTFPDMEYHHTVYRMLFFLPMVFGCFWFGLKGGAYVSASILIFYLPYVLKQWQRFSFEDFHRLSEIALYMVIAFILGFLVERGKRKHRALLRAESLAAIGRALSEVAHDMKTPLVAIGGFTDQVYRKLKSDDPNRKKLDVVIQEAARLESLVKNMLDFGRTIELQTHKINLNDLVLESLKVAQPLAEKAGVELKADLNFSLPPLLLDSPRVKQVLLNLLTNAVQASPAGEHILVKTRPARNGIVLEVIDRGCGINQEDHENVFQPFFSTKKGGSGLGLAIVKKIVEAHEGEASFCSNGQKGVTFRARFPFRESSEPRVIEAQ